MVVFSLSRAGVDEGIADLMRLVHSSTWFGVRGCTSVVRTWSGSRAGDPLGDLLFNLCFASLVRRAIQSLVEAGLVAMLPFAAATDILSPVVVPSDHV